jgi:hypothetical protein
MTTIQPAKLQSKQISEQTYNRLIKKYPTTDIDMLQSSLGDVKYFIEWIERDGKPDPNPFRFVHYYAASFG